MISQNNPFFLYQQKNNENIQPQEEEALVEEEKPLTQNPFFVYAEKNKPKTEFTPIEIAKDVGKQGIKETLIGAAGTWGDLAELAGLNKYDNSKNQKDFDTLEKINQPGYKLSITDLEGLSDDTIVPNSFRLPTSQNLREVNEAIGGPGEAETPQGRYAARSGKLYGSGLSFGQVNPLPAVAAGIAGQTVEEYDGGPLLQTAAEIFTLLFTQGKGSGKTLVGSAKKEVSDKINKLRQIGYSEQDITLAINSASKGKKSFLKASKGSKTEKAFENFAEHSDDMVTSILEKQIPGYEKGAKAVHEMASDAYGQVVQEASQLKIKKLDPFFDSMDKTLKEVKKTIGHNPEAKNFITELTEHTLDIISNPSADNMIDFYKRLNGLGKWVSRNQKDRIIVNVKESIKDTFRSEGKQGKELADKFDKVNAGIQKAYKAEDVSKIIDKATTQSGIDYKILNKSFDRKDNVKLFEDVLGKKQADNLQMIAKTGKEIKDFDKAYKATSLITGTPTSIATNLGYLIYSGSWPAIAGLKGMEAVGRKLAEKSLTDPKFQNLLIRGLHAIKNESPRSFRSANEALKEYLAEEGIKIDLD